MISHKHQIGLSNWTRRTRVATSLSALFFSWCIIGHFFAPYVAGSRLRLDVVTGILAVPLCLICTLPRQRSFRLLTTLVFASICWTVVRLAISPAPTLQQNVILWINSNFIASSVCLFICLKGSLEKYRWELLRAVLLISIPINFIALFQWWSPDHPFNSLVFDHYGGTLSDGVVSEFQTNAEFLVKAAGRRTSIFNGMHALAVYNVFTFAISFTAIADRNFRIVSTRVLIAVLLLSMVGGVVAASKCFFGGLPFVAVPLALHYRNRIGAAVLVICALIAMFIIVIPYLESEDRFGSIGRVHELMLSGDQESILSSRFDQTNGHLTPTISRLVKEPMLLFVGCGGELEGMMLGDNAYLPYILVGGLPLLLLALAAISLLLLENWRSYLSGDKWGLCFFSVHLALLAIGIGIPTYQLGRITSLILLLNLMQLRFWKTQRGRPSGLATSGGRTLHALEG